MKATVGLNEFVWVKLTKEGIQRHRNYQRDIGDAQWFVHQMGHGEVPEPTGWKKFQLDDLIAIFGPAMKSDSPLLFEGNEMHLTQPY